MRCCSSAELITSELDRRLAPLCLDKKQHQLITSTLTTLLISGTPPPQQRKTGGQDELPQKSTSTTLSDLPSDLIASIVRSLDFNAITALANSSRNRAISNALTKLPTYNTFSQALNVLVMFLRKNDDPYFRSMAERLAEDMFSYYSAENQYGLTYFELKQVRDELRFYGQDSSIPQKFIKLHRKFPVARNSDGTMRYATRKDSTSYVFYGKRDDSTSYSIDIGDAQELFRSVPYFVSKLSVFGTGLENIVRLESNQLFSLKIEARLSTFPALLTTRLITLDLTENQISALPKTLADELPNLQTLLLGRNKLKNINDVSFPGGLKMLNLRQNSIAGLSPEFSEKIPNLESLLLNLNPVGYVDLSLATSLQVLEVGNTRTELLPALPPNLTHLVALENNLKQVSIVHTALRSLDLTAASLDSIALDCPELRRLYVRMNLLRSLDLQKCQKLQRLNASDNKLQTITSTGSGDGLTLNLTNLRRLQLEKNNLSSSFLICKNLEQLDLSRNFLTSFTTTLLPNLESLFATKNLMVRVVIDSPKLLVVNLEENRLENIEILTTPLLRSLNVGWNRLNAIDLRKSNLLRKLFVSHNNITSLQDIRYPHQIDVVDVSDNKLTNVDASGIDTAELSLACCGLTTFPEPASLPPRIKVLRLAIPPSSEFDADCPIPNSFERWPAAFPPSLTDIYVDNGGPPGLPVGLDTPMIFRH